MTAIQFDDIFIDQEEFYCVNCYEFLWPPIMLGKKGNICGNCWKNDSDEFIPNIALEKTLENLIILCRNSDNGCKVRRHYKELAMHNKRCDYRMFCCPINSIDSCGYFWHYNELVDHFVKQHPEHIIKTSNYSVSLEVDVEKNAKQIKIITLPSKNFLLLINTDTVNQKLLVSVFHIDDPKSKANDYQFVVQLNTSDKDSVSHETNKSRIVRISNYSEDYKDGLKIDIGVLKTFSIDGIFMCTLKIISICENKSNEELLKYFECPVCKNYMRAPIYLCSSGHSICTQCKSKISYCPSCRSNYGNARNYALEDFSSGIYFPCSYQDHGCEQNFLLKDITNHEDECRFRSYICPFMKSDCKWIGLLKDLSAHLKDVHGNLTYATNQKKMKVPQFLNQSKDHTYCLVTYDEIFRVSYKNTNNCYGEKLILNWSVQLVGSKSQNEPYSYEITLVNEGSPHRKLTLLDLCQKYTNNDDVFKQCIDLPVSVSSAFLNNNELTYIVKIIRPECN